MAFGVKDLIYMFMLHGKTKSVSGRSRVLLPAESKQ